MNEVFIFAITKDDGYTSDPDAAVDKYHYFREDILGNIVEDWDFRQTLVNKVKVGEVAAYTYYDGHIGAKCTVKVSPHGVEYLKTIPDGNPANNISALPEM